MKKKTISLKGPAGKGENSYTWKVLSFDNTCSVPLSNMQSSWWPQGQLEIKHS